MSPDGLLSRLFVRYARGPEHKGKRRLIHLAARWLLPAEGVVADVNPGVRLLLHPRDWLEFLLLTTGQYEPTTLAWIDANLSPGNVAVLAGVNFGLHVAIAARRVGPTGLVIGIEPQPASLLRAAANLALNGFTAQVRLISAALGDENRLARMSWACPENTGAASFLRDGPTGFTATIMPTAAIVREVTDRPVRLMLLDVEGFEWFAVRGLGDGPYPELLAIEVIPELVKAAGIEPPRLFEQLVVMGYALHDLFGRPVSASAGALPEANLIAVRDGVRVAWPDRRPATATPVVAL